MYTYKEFLKLKISNSLLLRYEGMCDELQRLLNMPVAIVGMHLAFKHAVSGVEQDIRQVTPRCILTIDGNSLDSQALTNPQVCMNIISADETGDVAKHALPYRRMPMTTDFKVAIVLGDVSEAMLMTQYLALLAMEMPLSSGDEHLRSTILFDDSATFEISQDSNDVVVNTNLKLNSQIIVPMENALNDEAYPLAGVGIRNPDGSWNETPYGEPVVDDDGNPVLDDEGNPVIGNFIQDGWYRLHHHVKIHNHRQTEQCNESVPTICMKSGAELRGDVATHIDDL